MGIIRNGILGGFRKKVGAITGAFWKDLNVIKALPKISNKPPTQAQTSHRTKFGLVTAFLSELSELIDEGYSSSGSKSGMNEAVAYHMKNAVLGVSPNFTIDYTKVRFSTGKLAIPSTFSVDTVTAGKVDFNWSLEADNKYRDATDMINVLAYNPTKQQSVSLTAAAPRSAKTFSLQMPLDFVGDEVHCFFSFTSVKKKKFHSKSVYVLLIPIA
jgi:hypothetical protein